MGSAASHHVVYAELIGRLSVEGDTDAPICGVDADVVVLDVGYAIGTAANDGEVSHQCGVAGHGQRIWIVGTSVAPVVKAVASSWSGNNNGRVVGT